MGELYILSSHRSPGHLATSSPASVQAMAATISEWLTGVRNAEVHTHPRLSNLKDRNVYLLLNDTMPFIYGTKVAHDGASCSQSEPAEQLSLVVLKALVCFYSHGIHVVLGEAAKVALRSDGVKSKAKDVTHGRRRTVKVVVAVRAILVSQNPAKELRIDAAKGANASHPARGWMTTQKQYLWL